VAVIVAVPGALAVTKPAESTATMVGADDAHRVVVVCIAEVVVGALDSSCNDIPTNRTGAVGPRVRTECGSVGLLSHEATETARPKRVKKRREIRESVIRQFLEASKRLLHLWQESRSSDETVVTSPVAISATATRSLVEMQKPHSVYRREA
jgi:hypothetical protein